MRANGNTVHSSGFQVHRTVLARLGNAGVSVTPLPKSTVLRLTARVQGRQLRLETSDLVLQCEYRVGGLGEVSNTRCSFEAEGGRAGCRRGNLTQRSPQSTGALFEGRCIPSGDSVPQLLQDHPALSQKPSDEVEQGARIPTHVREEQVSIEQL